MYKSKRDLSILHIILAVRETSAPYNEHCLPWANKRDISICAYFRSDITPPRSVTLFEGDGSLRGFIRVLRAALEAKDYDVIHTHSPHVGFLFLVATLFAHRRFAPSTVCTVHDSYQNFKLRNRLMFLPVFATFERVVCCGRASFDSFPSIYKRLAGDRLRAVQNGLDIVRVDRVAENARQRLGRTRDFTLLAITRLVDIKNPFTVVGAFEQSTDQTSHLTYIGHGPLQDALVDQTREAGLDNQVEFTGLIPRETVFEHLLNSDLFISASKGEGLPISVLEAMACGCPILLSDIPPHREIADGVDFIPLIRTDDVAGFAREIKRFREMAASERTAIGQKCRKLVEEQFSLPAMHAGYAEVYAQITGKRTPLALEHNQVMWASDPAAHRARSDD